MASDQSANLALPYLAAAQAQKHVTHNEAVRRLDAHVQLALESVTTAEPPAAPAEGARWFVPAGATGAFAGQDGKLAAYEAQAFDFLDLPRDALAYIRDAETFARFDGGAWVALSSGDGQGAGTLVLESVTATAPAAAPDEGAVWFVPAGATGAFAGQAGSLATYQNGAFSFRAPRTGALAFIRDAWRLALFDGGAFVSPLAVRPARAAITAEVIEEDLVLSGASLDTAMVIPARAIVLGVSTRILSEVTGAPSFDCGVAGESGKFGSALGIALGASNSGVIGPTAFYAATPVRLSATSGVFTGGRVRVSIHMLTCPASAFPERETEWWAQAEYGLDGVPPALAADFCRERYALNGAHSSSPQVVARSGGAKAVLSAAGAVVMAPANVLAFDYASGRRQMVVEGAATNVFIGSAAPTAAQGITVTAQTYTVSFWGPGTLTLSGAATGTVTGGGTSTRSTYTITATAGTLTVTPSGTVTKVQVEVGSFATSYIETTTAAVTRTTDVATWSAAATALLSTNGPVTIALRGKLSHAASTASTGILSNTTTNILRVESAGTVRMYMASSSLNSGRSITAGTMTEAGICAAWDTAGRRIAVNGSTPVSDTAQPTTTIDTMYLGTPVGMNTRERFELDEILVWSVKGGASAVQGQARVWA
ncbi:DUF2793 domain-containing protein [Xanthobacter agilis]|uniref:Uncharacterized protein n=1 Tax=Xanthobacter agilis TaxID=47492 RepID=A0ABU0LHB8_XANAG|nr:DUF2793 domain-containing protein [Xanthobacter agilis]MDQ0506536.1 hypothetical protein [Xanthobacter agilis]